MDGLFSTYLPATFQLQWPVFNIYRLLSLESAIAFLEERSESKLTELEWRQLAEILDPSKAFLSSEFFQRVLLIVPTSETILRTTNPFSDFFNPEEPLLSLQKLAEKNIGWESEKDILQWVKKSGLLFNRPWLMPSPKDSLGIIDYTTDATLQSCLILEHWLYQKFGLYLMTQYHILYRARELKFVYQLAQLLKTASSGDKLIRLPSFSGFSDQDSESGVNDDRIREIIHKQFQYHLQCCTVNLNVTYVLKYKGERDETERSEESLPVLTLEPTSLFSALNLVFAKHILPNPNVGICEFCGTAFQRGRNWSKFCSQTCGTSYRKGNARKNKSSQ